MSNILETLRQEAESAESNPAENPAPEGAANDTPAAGQEAPADDNNESNSAPAEPDTSDANGGSETQPAPTTTSFVSEQAAKFNEFVRRTGKEDYREFEFWQKPTSEVDENELLRKYFSEQEGMSEKEIAFELNRITLPEKGDDDFDDFGDDEDHSEKEILRERTLRKAKAWHEGEFGKLSTEDGESAPVISERMTVDEYNQRLAESHQALHQENVTKVYETLPSITGLEMKIPGNDKYGIAPLDVVYTPDEDSYKTLRSVSEDAGVLVNEYFDEGKLTNPKGWIELMARVALSEKMIQYAVEQAVLNDRAAQDKRKRNITPDNYQSVTSSSSNSEEEFDSWRTSRKV